MVSSSGDGSIDSRGAFVAISDVIPVAPGYLALRAKEKVLVEYRGCDANGDQGWCFGCSLVSGEKGWLSEAAISAEPKTSAFGASLGNSTLDSELEVFADVPSPGPGYLALTRGEFVKIKYMGSEASNDAGWLFGVVVGTGQEGWFSAVAISDSIVASSCTCNEANITSRSCRTPSNTESVAMHSEPLLPMPERSVITALSKTDAVVTHAEPLPPMPARSVITAPSKPDAMVTHAELLPPMPERSVTTALSKTDAMVTHAEPLPPMPERSVITPSRCPSSTSRAAVIAAQDGLILLGSRSPEALPWQYPLCDSERGCFVGLLPGALSQAQAKKMYKLVYDGMEEAEWEAPIRTMNGKVWVVGHRQTKWFVDLPYCRCQYTYGGPSYGDGNAIETYGKSRAFPPWMRDVMKVVMPLCGLADPDSWPNCCTMNRYSPKAECDWHADDDEIFEGTKRNCSIISLSLGSKRVFELRRIGEKNTACKFDLNGGDLCTMEGMTQKFYQHAVFQQPGARINLTWRWIISHQTEYCPLGGLQQ